MSNYSVLKQDINNNIYENQTQQITGTVLNAILNEMTASLGAGYQFAGVATLGMNPGDPDQRVFYLAGEGIYTSFGGIQVPAGKLGVLKWDNRWTLQTIDGLGGGGANLTGYVSVASTDDLPEEGQPTLGYLCGTNLYLYVGTGGDTKEGKYQNCGSFRGPQGLQGDPGVGIASVTQTTTSTEDEGINVITVTKEDGTQSTFQVRNGSKGSQGIQGPQGVQGEPGRLQARYKQVETLPTASADTVDYIYLVASQTPNVYDMYYTEENQGAYSWKPLGTTAVQLSDYATKAEVSQLQQEVDLNKLRSGFGITVTTRDVVSFPEGITPLDKIQSSGEQYIDTGIDINSITGFEIEFNPLNEIGSTGYGCIFGGRQSSGQQEFQLTTYAAANSGNLGSFCNRLVSNTGVVNAHLVRASRNVCSWFPPLYTGNGVVVASSKANFTTRNNAFVFALNQSGTPTQYGTLELYRFRIFGASGLLRDFYPCKNENEEVGLYDSVLGEFFGNDGTGEFMAGTQVDTERGTYASADTAVEDNETSDLDICDENRHVLVRFANGHIMTKNFNSAQLSSSGIPAYWKNYLDNKLQSIKGENLSLGGSGVAFFFVTDTHWEDNAQKSPAVIKYLQEEAEITDCIFGGDVITDYGTRTNKLAEIYDFMSAMRPVSPFVLVGNHDYNTSDQPTSQASYLTDSNLISPGEFYRICNVPKENIVHYTKTEVVGKFDEYFGYRDNESQKVRFIFLDSGAVHIPDWSDSNLRISDAQIAWMKDRITELPRGWTVIVFTHIFFQNYSGSVHGIGTQIENALDSIYDTANAQIACVICGHVHGSVSKISAKGYPIISTTTDSAEQTNHESLNYEPGTSTEQAFDIYFINTATRSIRIVRIGAGDTAKDRQFTY